MRQYSVYLDEKEVNALEEWLEISGLTKDKVLRALVFIYNSSHSIRKLADNTAKFEVRHG